MNSKQVVLITGSSTGFGREFEEVIMVEVLIGEMFRSD
jgi:NADP-dependent 3-hydroxy acid dehydrogenase YdfG